MSDRLTPYLFSSRISFSCCCELILTVIMFVFFTCDTSVFLVSSESRACLKFCKLCRLPIREPELNDVFLERTF